MDTPPWWTPCILSFAAGSHPSAILICWKLLQCSISQTTEYATHCLLRCLQYCCNQDWLAHQIRVDEVRRSSEKGLMGCKVAQKKVKEVRQRSNGQAVDVDAQAWLKHLDSGLGCLVGACLSRNDLTMMCKPLTSQIRFRQVA